MTRVVVLVEGNAGSVEELLTSPWKEFFKELESIGSLTFSPTEVRPDDVVISFGNPHNLNIALKMVNLGKNRVHVIVREAPTIRPDWYRKSFLRKFDHRWAPSPLLAERIGGGQYAWPQHIPELKPQLSTEEWVVRSDSPSLFLANKYSAIAGDLYWVRRDLVSLATKEKRNFDLIGETWTQSSVQKYREILGASYQAFRSGSIPRIKFKDLIFTAPKVSNNINYIGYVADKYSSLARYKWTFVPENNADWVTEKVVDAIVAGCIPIYCGADFSRLGLPNNLCARTSANAREMWDALDEMKNKSSSDLLGIRMNALDVIYDKEFIAKHRNDNALRHLGTKIKTAVFES